VGATTSRHHQTAAFHANLQPAQYFGSVADGIVSRVEAVESVGMILFVKAFRAQEQMQVSECPLNFDGFVVRYFGWDAGDCTRKLAQ